MITYEKVTATFTYESEASGIVSASSWAGQGQMYGNNYKPWYAFNGQWGYDQKTWATTNNLPQWIQYKFPSPVCVRRVITVNRNEDGGSLHNNRAASDFTLQGSNDGSTWTNIQNCSIAQSTGHYKETIDIQNQNEYLYYRLYVTNNFNNTTGTGCGFAEVEMYKGIEEHIDEAGEINAIRDWTQSTRYVKDDIDYFFMRMVNDGLTAYAIKFIGSSNQMVTIVGQTSDQEYEIKLNSDGEYSGLFFFETEETLDISIKDIYSHKQITLPANTSVTISLAKTYHIYKDGQIINSKQIQIDYHTTGRWRALTDSTAVVNANNALTYNSWPSNGYFRESYIRTGIPVNDGDTAVLLYETNYETTNNDGTSYNPVKSIDSDGELIITFIQTIWDRIDYRNKFQYFGMQWLDQNDAYRPLFLDPDPNSPLLREQYGVYVYKPVDGNFNFVSISELTANVFGDPEIVLSP